MVMLSSVPPPRARSNVVSSAVNVKLDPGSLKAAVTVKLPLIVSAQGPVPEHEPLHPTKLAPFTGEAVKVTWVPFCSISEQEAVQLNCAPSLTVPFPMIFTDNLRF